MIIFLIPSHTFGHLDTLILDWMLIGRPDLLKKNLLNRNSIQEQNHLKLSVEMEVVDKRSDSM